MPEIKVENIVASTSFAEKLELDMISQSLEETEYEPEQFPGLVYRIKEPKVAMLLFGSGKIVCTGARKVSDVLWKNRLRRCKEGIRRISCSR